MDKIITKEWVQKAKEHGACYEALVWLKRVPRTWSDLVRRSRSWAGWAMLHISDCPIELKDTTDLYRARIMIVRKEIEINLTLLSSWGKAYVMMHRLDCPINLKGLRAFDKARVLVARPNCPNILDMLPKTCVKYVKEFISDERWKQLTGDKS